MTVSLEKEAEIRRLFFAEHWKRGTIAAQLGVHPDVVARVIGHLGPRAHVGRPDARVLEPFEAWVDETLARYPRLVATRLFDMLRERGYEGSVVTLRRYVRRARPQPKTEAFLRLQTLPGEQAQIDWAHVGQIPVRGGYRALWVFVLVLAYSRACFAELVLSLDVHSLRRSLVRAGVALGGLPRQWLCDNAKTIVIERQGDAVRFHPLLLDLAARLHVQPRLCAPRRPQEKGGVERAIRFFKERFFVARSFHSLEQGNAQLIEFIDTIAHRRPHPRWPERSVAEVFAEEQLRLLPLPEPLPHTDLVTLVPVDRTAFVRLDTNRYSVPHIYAGRTLTLVASDTELRLLDGDQPVAHHAREWGRNQWLELPAHRAALVEEKRAARALKGRDRLRAEVPEIEPLFERWVDAGRNLGSMVARVIVLLDAYGAPAMREVLTEMVARGTHDPGAMAILCEQRRRARGDRPPRVVAFGDHVRERDVVPHDLGGYDE
jgi:transposase